MSKEQVICKLSKKGLQWLGGCEYSRGILVPYKKACKGSREGFIKVKWDDRKTIFEYHKDFIELIYQQTQNPLT